MNEKLEREKKNFANHKATLSDLGKIKILDFKNPESSNYRIRFLFEQDYCRLHISGDLGELSATNYNNMTFEGFKDFVHNVGYFKEKIDCHSRAIYFYDEDQAKADILERFEKEELVEFFTENYYFDEETDDFDEYLDDYILRDFDGDSGLSVEGAKIIQDLDCDSWEYAGGIGRKETGILDLYMLAFELATDQLRKEGVIK